MNFDHKRRFGGLVRLYGELSASRIFNAHVVIVGIGGVGSWSAEALARSGVGRITLVDMDHISESNINRQLHALDSTLGQSKLEAMRDRIIQINPECHIHLVDDFVTPENWDELISSIAAVHPITGVIDACDQVISKTKIAEWALCKTNSRILTVSVGAAGGKRRANLCTLGDLIQVTHDPLLSKVRYKLRRQGLDASRKLNIGLMCVYSSESAKKMEAGSAASSVVAGTARPVTSDGSLNCHGYGSTVCVTGPFGFLAANWIIEGLCKADSST